MPEVVSTATGDFDVFANPRAKYADDRFYEKFIFGRYHFALIDERGNNIYHANIKGTDWFVLKVSENDWVVSNTYKNSVYVTFA